MSLTIAELFDDSNEFADMIQTKGWETLMRHVLETIADKRVQLEAAVFDLVLEDTKKKRETIVDLRTEIKVLGGAFSIPKSLIDHAIQVRKEQQEAGDVLETTGVPQPPKLVLAQH